MEVYIELNFQWGSNTVWQQLNSVSYYIQIQVYWNSVPNTHTFIAYPLKPSTIIKFHKRISQLLQEVSSCSGFKTNDIYNFWFLVQWKQSISINIKFLNVPGVNKEFKYEIWIISIHFLATHFSAHKGKATKHLHTSPRLTWQGLRGFCQVLTIVSVTKGTLCVPVKCFDQFCGSHTCFDQNDQSVLGRSLRKIKKKKQNLNTHTFIVHIRKSLVLVCCAVETKH